VRTSRVLAWTAGSPVARLVCRSDSQRATSTAEHRRWDAAGITQRRAVTLCPNDEAGGGADRGAFLLGTNTRRVRRALGALFKGAFGEELVSRTWRKVQMDWNAWCRGSLAEEDVVRLILERWCGCGSIARRRRTRWWCLAFGAMDRRCFLAVRNMGGESERA